MQYLLTEEEYMERHAALRAKVLEVLVRFRLVLKQQVAAQYRSGDYPEVGQLHVEHAPNVLELSSRLRSLPMGLRPHDIQSHVWLNMRDIIGLLNGLEKEFEVKK